MNDTVESTHPWPESGATSAGQWRDWLRDRPLPPFALDRSSRVLVVSAHPDDEILGAGGLMADHLTAGGSVTVLCLSDGAASHPGSPTVTPEELAVLRRSELQDAMSTIGVTHVQHVGLPDGELAEHESDCVDAVIDAVATFGGHDHILAPWRGDRHPDREAAGRAGAVAAGETGAVFVEYPVWMWQWAVPTDESVPWDRTRIHPLTDETRRSKTRAVAAFASQIVDLSTDPADRAVLPPDVVDRLTGPTEVFFT